MNLNSFLKKIFMKLKIKDAMSLSIIINIWNLASSITTSFQMSCVILVCKYILGIKEPTEVEEKFKSNSFWKSCS